MENKKQKKVEGMLPGRFKAIGIAILVICAATAILGRIIKFEFITLHLEYFKAFTINGFVLGLLLIAGSRDKVEDELTQLIRLRAMAYALMFGALLVVIRPLIDVMFRDPVSNISGQQLILTMLTIYLITYYIKRAAR